jgi:excisionase family DNA binding protein
MPELQSLSADDVYIRTAEAAKILRVSPKTVSRWAKEGKIPHVLTLGGHRRFPAEAIQALARRLEIV